MESKGKDLTIRFRASDMEREMIEEIAAHLDTDMSGAIRKLITVAYENMIVNELSAVMLEGMTGSDNYRKLIADEYLFSPMSARMIVADAHMAILETLKGQPVLFRMVAAYLDTGGNMEKVTEAAERRLGELQKANAELREMVRKAEQDMGVAE